MSAGCFNIDIDNRIIDTFHQCRVGNLMSTMYPSDITSDITSVVTADLSDTTTYQEKLERYGIGGKQILYCMGREVVMGNDNRCYGIG